MIDRYKRLGAATIGPTARSRKAAKQKNRRTASRIDLMVGYRLSSRLSIKLLNNLQTQIHRYKDTHRDTDTDAHRDSRLWMGIEFMN